MTPRAMMHELIESIQEACPDCKGWQAWQSRRELEESEVALVLVLLITRMERDYPTLVDFYKMEARREVVVQ